MTILSDPKAALVTGGRSQSVRYLPMVALGLDLLLMCVAVAIGVVGRQRLPIFDSQADVSSSVAIGGPIIVLGWLLATYLLHGYRADVFGAGPDEYKRVLNAGLLAAGFTGVVCYLADFALSRGFFLLTFVVGAPALLVGRLVLRRGVHTARRRGSLLQSVLIAGGVGYIDEIAAVLRRESWLGYRVEGALTPATNTAFKTPSGIPVVGNADDATAAVLESGVDVIFFAGGAHTSTNQMRKVMWELERHDVQIVMAPSISDISGERIRIRPVGGLPLVHLDPPTWSDASRLGKRTFDLVGSLGLILLFSPLFAFAALRIKLHDRAPVFFRQTRVGRHGAEFDCLKLRSMVTDAEARLQQLHDEQGYVSGLFKIKDDPRITGPGRWLRRYSIDELPQLINVVRGEMSLVGPRPPLPLEVASYEVDTARRLHVRPGMTGLWQVSGRSDLSWEEAVRLDLYYVDNWSMLQDLNILAKTLGAVLGSSGAY